MVTERSRLAALRPGGPPPHARGGFALVMTVLVVVIVGSLVAGATLVGSNYIVVNDYYNRESQLAVTADGGLEWAWSVLSADASLYPDSGYVTLEEGSTVTDALGDPLPGVRRWLYAGPTPSASGQPGASGSIVAVVEDAAGVRVIRRSHVYPQSFARYAYFSDAASEDDSFGNDTRIFGPVHSNASLGVRDSGATFFGPVTSAQGVSTPEHGVFEQGYEEFVTPVPMPSVAELEKLREHAALGATAFLGDGAGHEGRAAMRIEFVAVDLNGDGDENDADEGFIRVYRAADADWVTARGDVEASDQCGDEHDGAFVSTNAHPFGGHSAQDALRSATGRCYLGGDDFLWGSFRAVDEHGAWLPSPLPVPPAVAATERADAAYLVPINRVLNPNFRGVIHVEGTVVVSGRLRGRITLAATGDIVFGDDLTYVTDPAAATCVDIAGYVAGDDVVVANNAVNAPQRVRSDYYSLDDSPAGLVHGTVLALDGFEFPDAGISSDVDPCESDPQGRGCLYLTGGLIQRALGNVGGRGADRARLTYDPCGETQPPPLFPTTGTLVRGAYYPVDPTRFDVDDYFGRGAR